MGAIHVFNGISIYIYFGDHNPPHFHAFYGEFEVLIRISDGGLIRGKFPARQLRMIKEWMMNENVKANLNDLFNKSNPELRKK